MNAGQRRLEQKLAAAWPPGQWRDMTVMVAVSGGPDSVALLRGMAALKLEAGGAGRMIVAHFHHHLRGGADDDAQFAAALAGRLELPFERGDADVRQLTGERGDGVEAAAREARYAFLQSTAQCQGARYVVTGHTADDQVETVLFNIVRGTGLTGLAGIPRVRMLGPAVSLLRPLLAVRRSEVLEYLEAINQPFCTDPTNTSCDFARNQLRHQLLPLLREKYNPDIDSSLLRLSQVSSDAQQLIAQLADELLDRCLSGHSAADQVTLDTKPLIHANRHLVRELFVALWRRRGWPVQDMGFSEWDLLAEMALVELPQPPMGRTKRTLPGKVHVQRQSDMMTLMRQDS